MKYMDVGVMGYNFFPDLAEVGILLFVDDIVLIADSVFELRCDEIRCCMRWQ